MRTLTINHNNPEYYQLADASNIHQLVDEAVVVVDYGDDGVDVGVDADADAEDEGECEVVAGAGAVGASYWLMHHP